MFRSRQDLSADPLLAVLRGDFSSSTVDAALNIAPKGKIKIIFSSTFTDTEAERDCVLEELSVLQAKGRESGVYVVFVDMRYGVKDENTQDHLTWIACADQIRRCFEESDGLFFVSLQGDKYGYMPLAKYLPVTARNPTWSAAVLSLFDAWYSLDENAIPAQYVLKNLTGDRGIDKEYWGDRKDGIVGALTQLREALDGTAFDTASSDSILVGRSVTEYEVRLAMALDPAMNRCFWLRREFSRAVTAQEDSNGHFCDFLDPSQDAVRSNHAELISTMQNRFPPQEVCMVQAASVESYQSKDGDHMRYMDQWKVAMRSRLDSDLDAVIAKKRAWATDGTARGVAGADLDEMLHHCKLVVDKCNGFLARTDLIDKAMTAIVSYISPLPVPHDDDHDDIKVLDVCLSVIGVSGAGKTALMSKLASLSAVAFPSVPVIVRFCGTSQGSVDGLVLVRSICLQIQLVHSLPRDAIPTSYTEAVQLLHELLGACPVLLFIDSLDQLSDRYQARSKLSFLVGLRCHPKGRIIVSALPDDRNEVTGQWGRYVYLCDTRLREFDVPRVIVTSFEGDQKQARQIIEGKLFQLGRSVTTAQMQYVLTCAAVEPTALYLHLTSNVIRHWTSNWALPSTTITQSGTNICHLEGSVKGLIHQIFDSLERSFGRCLVRNAIGFITFTKAGMRYIFEMSV